MSDNPVKPPKEVGEGRQQYSDAAHRRNALAFPEKSADKGQEGHTEKHEAKQEPTEAKREPPKEYDVKRNELSPELQKDVRSAEAARDSVGPVPEGKAGAATEGGKRQVSGWKNDEATVDAVKARCKEIGYTPTRAGGYDRGEPGKYNLSHAEKKISVTDPGKPIGETPIAMCDDCKRYFSASAQFDGKPYVVADPFYTRIFQHDGRIERVVD